MTDIHLDYNRRHDRLFITAKSVRGKTFIQDNFIGATEVHSIPIDTYKDVEELILQIEEEELVVEGP